MKLYLRISLHCLVVLLISGSVNAQQARRRVDLSIPEVEKKDLICFALYTVSDKTLKLTAQMYPLADDDPKPSAWKSSKNGDWVEVARAT